METLGEIPVDVKKVSGATLVVLEHSVDAARFPMDATDAGWAIDTELGASGLDYRFELDTLAGVVRLPVDGGFLHLFAAGPDSETVTGPLSELRAVASDREAFGSEQGQLGRSDLGTSGSEGFVTGPGPVVVLNDGSVAVLDSLNARVVIIGRDQSKRTIDLPQIAKLVSDGATPAIDSFVINDMGSGAFSVGSTVFAFGAGRDHSYEMSDRQGYPLGVQNLELHGDLIVAFRINGEAQVIGTLSGAQTEPFTNEEPTTMRINELLGDAVYVHVPGSTVGMIVSADGLTPFAGSSRIAEDGTGVGVFLDAKNQRVIVIRIPVSGEAHAFVLVDEGGSAFVPASGGLDQGAPSLAVSPDGERVAVLECSEVDCTTLQYELPTK